MLTIQCKEDTMGVNPSLLCRQRENLTKSIVGLMPKKDGRLIRAEINEMGTKRATDKIKETKSWLF